jgi:cytochrome b pre-mRNA-processing protein 3
MTMILPLFNRRRRPSTISTLYGMIVAQARMPCFYRDYGVPDTVDGRFELLVVHLAAVLQPLMRGGAESKAFGQDLFDCFCWDMDDNLRELGIGDLKVPKEMTRIGQAFYGRAQAYEAALASSGTEQLEQALARNVYGATNAEQRPAKRLAAYVSEAVGGLGRQDDAAIRRAEVVFPDPAAVSV